jgi:hypothetical protein
VAKVCVLLEHNLERNICSQFKTFCCDLFVVVTGFFPPGDSRGSNGERFLRQLAAATGGTFQVYDADITPEGTVAAAGVMPSKTRVYDDQAGKFVPYDLAAETSADRGERLWAEAELRKMRTRDRRWAQSSIVQLT